MSTTLPDGVPPRVTFPDDPEKQAVVDAVYAYFESLNAAQAAPSDGAARASLEAAMTSPISERVRAYLDQLALDGEAFIDVEPAVTSIDIFGEVVSVVADSALVDACVVDRTTHFELGGGPDGIDRVISDQVIAAVLSYSLIRSEEGWRVSDLAVASRYEGRESCG